MVILFSTSIKYYLVHLGKILKEYFAMSFSVVRAQSAYVRLQANRQPSVSLGVHLLGHLRIWQKWPCAANHVNWRTGQKS